MLVSRVGAGRPACCASGGGGGVAGGTATWVDQPPLAATAVSFVVVFFVGEVSRRAAVTTEGGRVCSAGASSMGRGTGGALSGVAVWDSVCKLPVDSVAAKRFWAAARSLSIGVTLAAVACSAVGTSRDEGTAGVKASIEPRSAVCGGKPTPGAPVSDEGSP